MAFCIPIRTAAEIEISTGRDEWSTPSGALGALHDYTNKPARQPLLAGEETSLPDG
jgi:hypothetical protein